MKKTKVIFIICILSINTSCSSLSKSMIYSTITGLVIGGIAGRYLSPDKESNNYNMALLGGVGAVAGVATGYYFFKQDPDNRTMKTMIDPEIPTKLKQENYDIGVPVDQKIYRIKPDTSSVPEHLKDKVKKQIIIEKTIPSRVEQEEGGKSLYIPEQKVIEYDYE